MLNVVKVKHKTNRRPFNDTPERVKNSTDKSGRVLEFGHDGRDSNESGSNDEWDWEEVAAALGRKRVV